MAGSSSLRKITVEPPCTRSSSTKNQDLLSPTSSGFIFSLSKAPSETKQWQVTDRYLNPLPRYRLQIPEYSSLPSAENVLYAPGRNAHRVLGGIFFSCPAETEQGMLGLVVFVGPFPGSSALLRRGPPIFCSPGGFGWSGPI